MAKITNQKIITLLEEFSEIQENLIDEFLNTNLQVKESSSLFKAKRKGAFFLFQKEWNFQIHGQGICFTEKNTGAIVDVHRGLFQYKNAFDSWRLAEYFESRGLNNIYYKSNKYDLKDDDDVQKILTNLKDDELIKNVAKEKNLYTL